MYFVSIVCLFTDHNGDGYLDTGELEALFVKEVSSLTLVELCTAPPLE